MRVTLLSVLAFQLAATAPQNARGNKIAASVSSEESERKPWTVYGSIGFPGITSIALARWIGPVEVMAELGTLAPFPILATGTAHLQFDLITRKRLAVFAGASVTSLYFWFTDGEGQGVPFWNWGVGPKLGLRHTFVTGSVLAIEAGALYGHWNGTCNSCNIMPEIMARIGWPF